MISYHRTLGHVPLKTIVLMFHILYIVSRYVACLKCSRAMAAISLTVALVQEDI